MTIHLKEIPVVNLSSRIKRVIKFNHDEREEKQPVIASAIRQLRPIEFYYHGGYRTVGPFALGIVLTERRDNLSLLCWQTGGLSDNDEIAGWKLYRVSDMEDLEVVNVHFTGDRPGYSPANLDMARLIAFVRPTVPPPEEIMVPAPQAETKVSEPPPPVKVRPIVRVLSHNELMECFRDTNPRPIPQLEAMVREEPLEKPYPEPGKNLAEEE